MRAVIRVGSHQFDVTPGQVITVEKINGVCGSEVHFNDVLMLDDGDRFDVGAKTRGKVIGTIRAQVRGPKMTVFKKKRRKGFSRTQGHRQPYTRIEITRIEV